jgi:tetratricopeptide (TPR) repeat protein
LAIKFSNKAISISPSNTNLWKERAQMYYYLSTLDTKYFQESINSLTQVTVLAPTDAHTYYLIGQFLDSAELKKEAASYYQKAIELKPNYDHAYFALGFIQFEQKDYSNAKNNFESALKINPKNSVAIDLINQINNKNTSKK